MTDMASGESYPCVRCGHLLGSEACDCYEQPQLATPRTGLTVSTMADVTMSITAPLSHRCPFVDEVDVGTAEVSWRCNGQTLELHALRTWLDQWAPCDVSHEEITDVLFNNLSSIPGIADVTIVTHWTTAGMSVTVTGGDGALLREPVHAKGA